MRTAEVRSRKTVSRRLGFMCASFAALFSLIGGAAAQDLDSHHHTSADPTTTMADETITQDWAKDRLAKSPRHREWVKVKNGNREVNTFVVYPESNKKATAVVVIHEIFGMSDWV